MVPIDQLREWAGVTGNSQDATLLLIEAGVLDLISQGANRLLRCPPEPYTQIFDVRAARSGGLSGDGADPTQRVRLVEVPQSNLTGTVSVDPGGTAVTGTGTKFQDQLSSSPASTIQIGDQHILVDAIASDTSLELAEAHVGGATDSTAHAPIIWMRSRPAIDQPWVDLNPRDYELDGRSLYTTDVPLDPGRRTLQLAFLVGNEEGEGPDDVVLLLLEMVKSVYARKRRRSSSVAVDGAFKISWASLGDEADSFHKKVKAIKRPAGF